MGVSLSGNASINEVSIYRHGCFIDLCKGPHVESTAQVKAFKLLSVAGAYWHGLETNPMLQRIYGTAFPTEKDLRKYLNLIKEAEKSKIKCKQNAKCYGANREL